MDTYDLRKKDVDKYLEGQFYRGFELFGAHIMERDEKMGVRFSVYAPNALSVRVVGDFNQWDPDANFLEKVDDRGVYVGFVPGATEDSLYKYAIESRDKGVLWKNDPYGYKVEQRPQGASIVCDLSGFYWEDDFFLSNREKMHSKDAPMAVYEVNLSSWRKNEEEYYTYAMLERELIPYVKEMGYTHIELMPVTEHPYDGSWGYQQIGYYAITSRFGSPQEFMRFVNACHKEGIGVLIDWVPVHYPKDSNGLAYFDGQAVYESDFFSDAYNPQWDTLNFDYGKTHVRNFMVSNAVFLAETFHIDGFRVDAVADLIYKKFHGMGESQSSPYGIAFIKELNKEMRKFPHVLMIAEESSAFYGVTKPVEEGGLGFDLKWNMGWMNDTLTYFSMDPYFRQFHHDKLTFPMVYAYSEYYVLPLSHDEVVHGKKSLLEKMPGDYKDKFSQLKILYLYQYTHPGKKLLFMGGEFAQFIEWNEWQALDWHLLDYQSHFSIVRYVRKLNHIYINEKPLHEIEDSWEGYQWISVDNNLENVITYARYDREGNEIIVAINFSPHTLKGYQTAVKGKKYKVILNSDDSEFYGEDRGSKGIMEEENGVLLLDIPGFSGLILKEGK